MTRLDQSPDIIELAKELGANDAAPVEGILNHCHSRIDDWVAEAGGVSDIDALETLVTQKLQMVFEEINSDDDFRRLTEVYAKGKKDPVFATMRVKFDDADNPTFGALIKRRNTDFDAPDRFVAVIDCRGNKSSRRFFTRWHEIAHRLTTHADGGETSTGYRSEHDPIEQLMDQIAGHVGFYDPIFAPVFRNASEGKSHLTFETVERVVSVAFPRASFQATLIASIRRMMTPVIHLEATPAYNKEMKRRLATKSLFDEDPVPAELRAVKVIQNPAARRDGFMIPKNYRVPHESVIHRVFESESLANGEGLEDMSQWESQGRSLEARAIVVEARKVFERVIAIVQPVEARREQERIDSKSFFLE
jgi:hypothetical protein